MQKQTKTKTTELQKKTRDLITIQIIDTLAVEISKTTDITIKFVAPKQQQNRNNTNQQPFRHCNRTNHLSRDYQACFNCGRLGHMSRECRAPRRNQNNRQQNPNTNQKPSKLAELQSRPPCKFVSTAKYFKLGQSTCQGQHVDDTNEGPLTQLLNSVVDQRSLYEQTSILNKQVEAVCDRRASVSCLSEKLFNQINENHRVKIQPSTTRLSSAKQMPIQIKGPVSVPIKIGSKAYEHTFYVLKEEASDCLLGLDFLETNNCEALFSEGKLKTDRNILVPFYRKQFSFDEKQVERVVALEKVSIPPQHVRVVPGTIPGWKVPPVARVALFEPHERFINNENQIGQDALFSFEKGIVPLTIANIKDEVLTIYKDTTLGSSQLVSDRLIQEINQKQLKNYNEVDPKYDLENVRKAISKEINNNCRADFRNSINDYSDIFSINQWDPGKCDATGHRVDVKPGSQPIKLPNRRTPVHYKDDLKDKKDAFINKELITLCHSPYSAPAMVVPKKNGKLLLVIDYTKLNEQTIKSCWPIPTLKKFLLLFKEVLISRQ